MATWIIKGGATFAGRDASWGASVDGNGELIVNPTLTAGQSATSWTYASDSTGTAVMPAGHTIQSADKVDVYWASGLRYGLTATVTVNSVALSGGAGTALPATATAVLLCVQVPIDFAVVGDNTNSIVGIASYRSLVCLVDSGNAIKAFELSPTAGYARDTRVASDNPLSGFTVVSGTMSTTDPVSTLTEKPVTFGVLFDSTPNYPG